MNHGIRPGTPQEPVRHDSIAPLPARRSPRRRPPWRLLALVAFVAVCGGAVWEYEYLPDVRPLATRNPPTTALIEQRSQEALARGVKPRRRQQWEPLGALSPQLAQAVLTSEDARFYQHHGVDYDELSIALQAAWRRRTLGRGASTITQQLAKNLWLSTDRSLLRKAKELVLAERLETALGKQRILALYLNVVEWGDGVYGAEAAAQEHFGVHAADLSLAQCAVLAAMLPAPRRRTPQSHAPALERRALWILDHMVESGKISPLDSGLARGEVERVLSGPRSGDEADDSDE
jgi:monofunctional biosynthetic peptidoglycan transglycosylase